MGCIAVDDLSQGMVLSEDVRDVHCRLLLSKGQKICDNHLRILKIWGICQVQVVGGHKEGGWPCPATRSLIDMPRFRPRSRRFSKIWIPATKPFTRFIMPHWRIVAGKTAPTRTCTARVCRTACALRGGIEEIRRRIVRENLQLPDAPTIISELNAVIADPFATSNDVAQVVHKSPTLASHLLKIVNSAYYGFPF
jgi:hypothetical protein